MLEIMLAVITCITTIIATFTGALAVRNSKCESKCLKCVDIIMETEPE